MTLENVENTGLYQIHQMEAIRGLFDSLLESGGFQQSSQLINKVLLVFCPHINKIDGTWHNRPPGFFRCQNDDGIWSDIVIPDEIKQELAVSNCETRISDFG